MIHRYQLPLKVALALTLAVVSALWLGWEKPYWAAFSVVVMAVTESSGHSLKKGRHRIIGTFFGILVAFILVGLFAQSPVELLTIYCLFCAVCVYQQTNLKNGYAWSICMMVATLVMVMGGFSSEQLFTIAVLRIQETILGVVCFSLVFSLLWPASSRVLLLRTLHSYYQQQALLITTVIDDLAQTGQLPKEYSLGNSIKRLSRLDDLIQAAMADSYELGSTAKQWQQLLQLQNQWALICGHLYEATRSFNQALTHSQCDEIRELMERLRQRALDAAMLLENQLSPDEASFSEVSNIVQAKPVRLIDEEDYAHQSHGALRMLANTLNQMDVHQQNMQICLHNVFGAAQELMLTPSRHVVAAKRPLINIDAEQAINAFKVSIMLLISIMLWLYVPLPGGPMIMIFGGTFGAVVLSIPFASTRSLLFYMLGWALVALVQYVFVLPHLTEAWQLGAFYFINTFVIWSVFNQPQHIFHRLLGTMNLVLMTNSAMRLTPTYDIQYALLLLLLFSIGMLVIFFVNHGVFSGNPERVLLRQLGYFRRSLQACLQDQIHGQKLPWLSFISRRPVREVAMAETAIGAINWPAFPQLDRIQAEKLISQLYRICLHYHAFVDSYRQWQAHDFNSAIDNLIQRELVQIVMLFNNSMIGSDAKQYSTRLNQLQQSLQYYLAGLEPHSPLQLALSQQQADHCYQLIISLQILIESLQQLLNETKVSELECLRLSPFTI